MVKGTVMALRILMIGAEGQYLKADKDLLRQRGFRVYSCHNKRVVNEMLEEVRPDLVFINSKRPDKESTDIYHSLIDNVVYASLPVVYTLAEDEVYLVNRKRTTIKERRYTMSDNIVDAIRTALNPAGSPARKRVRFENPQYSNISTAYRA